MELRIRQAHVEEMVREFPHLASLRTASFFLQPSHWYGYQEVGQTGGQIL
ncbi:MAG: hypothetical protein ACYCR3_10815 [Acidithiobacillus sp.]